jgi:hypothetical protein
MGVLCSRAPCHSELRRLIHLSTKPLPWWQSELIRCLTRCKPYVCLWLMRWSRTLSLIIVSCTPSNSVTVLMLEKRGEIELKSCSCRSWYSATKPQCVMTQEASQCKGINEPLKKSVSCHKKSHNSAHTALSHVLVWFYNKQWLFRGIWSSSGGYFENNCSWDRASKYVHKELPDFTASRARIQ